MLTLANPPVESDHSSGRWRLGSHWPNSSRNENTRSLARARSSSRRAPPNAASKPCSSIASSNVVVWRRLRDARGPFSSTTRPLSIESCTWATTSRSPSFRDQVVAELDDLREVVAGVDVHDREREARRAEGLLGQAQEHDRVLAAAEQQHRPLELRRHLPEDVDRLGLERLQVRELVLQGSHRGASPLPLSFGPTSTTWIPHSSLSWPAQRPSRPEPGWVQGAQPIEA